MDRDLLPALGHVALDKLRTEDLDRYYHALLAHGSRGRPLAPASIRRIHGICAGHSSRPFAGAGWQ